MPVSCRLIVTGSYFWSLLYSCHMHDVHSLFILARSEEGELAAFCQYLRHHHHFCTTSVVEVIDRLENLTSGLVNNIISCVASSAPCQPQSALAGGVLHRFLTRRNRPLIWDRHAPYGFQSLLCHTHGHPHQTCCHCFLLLCIKSKFKNKNKNRIECSVCR